MGDLVTAYQTDTGAICMLYLFDLYHVQNKFTYLFLVPPKKLIYEQKFEKSETREMLQDHCKILNARHLIMYR